MVRILIIMGLILGMTNCISMKTPDEFSGYIEDFRWDCTQNIDPVRCDNMLDRINATIEVPDIPYAAGMCLRDYWFGTTGRVILVNMAEWEKLGPFQRKSLIYHELTHCLTGRLLHPDRQDSIMFYAMQREEEIARTWSKEVKLLFKEYYK